MQPGEEALLLAPLTRTSRGFAVFVGLLMAVVGVGGAAYVYQFVNGLGVTGMNRPVYWGVYIGVGIAPFHEDELVELVTIRRWGCPHSILSLHKPRRSRSFTTRAKCGAALLICPIINTVL